MNQISIFENTDKSIANHVLPTNLTTNKHSFHRWFNFTAGYSPEYVDICIEKAKLNKESIVLEPFSGCGTTLVQANKNNLSSIGFEMNPFFVDICNAKVLCDFNNRVVLEIKRDLESVEATENLEEVYSESAYKYLSKLFSQETLALLNSAREIVEGYDGEKKYIAKIILSEVLDLCSHAQTDGIYKAPTSTKRATQYEVALEKVCKIIAEDLMFSNSNGMKNKATIYYHSSENMDMLKSSSCDIVITSPPYLNNFDFAEMTRMYLYFWKYADRWGEITDKVTTKLIVNTTTALRGHKERIDIYRENTPQVVHNILDKYQEELFEKRKSKQRGKQYDFIIYPYFSQMTNVLRSCFRVLKNRAPIHIIVADAALYGVHIKTHEVLASIMTEIGYSDVKINKLRDRGTRWVLEKREGTAEGLGEFEIVAYASH